MWTARYWTLLVICSHRISVFTYFEGYVDLYLNLPRRKGSPSSLPDYSTNSNMSAKTQSLSRSQSPSTGAEYT
ncbi:hypothetical protein ACN38_g5003 [Penicillium nordicum]|uniref:Uncharacterized protein n=1 Tax=Penicillium nordicum TaxID=229535 RepID=A0A0M8PAH3_9EURO|nr:hypothetical protein ACN38_g5003 [Penicillium nordicum]